MSTNFYNAPNIFDILFKDTNTPTCQTDKNTGFLYSDNTNSTTNSLKESLHRQIEETNRINTLYQTAIKRIAYLEHENDAYKHQLEKFYKIKELLME